MAKLRVAVLRVLRSLPLIALTLFTLILVSGGFYALAESKTFGEGLWWALVTAPTVGYGDHYPVTMWGRVVYVFLIGGSAYIISPLIIGHIILRMLPDPHAFTHEEQLVVLGRLEDHGQALLLIGERLGIKEQVQTALDTHPAPSE